MSVTEKDIKEGKINDELGTQLEALSAQVEAGFEQGKNAWAEWRASANEKARRAAGTLNRMTHERPWQVVCGATVLGMILGLMCAPRRRSRV